MMIDRNDRNKIKGGEKERYVDAREYEEIVNLILSPWL